MKHWFSEQKFRHKEEEPGLKKTLWGILIGVLSWLGRKDKGTFPKYHRFMQYILCKDYQDTVWFMVTPNSRICWGFLGQLRATSRVKLSCSLHMSLYSGLLKQTMFNMQFWISQDRITSFFIYGSKTSDKFSLPDLAQAKCWTLSFRKKEKHI